MRLSLVPLLMLVVAGSAFASDAVLEQLNDHIMLGSAVNTKKQEASGLICVTERGSIRSLPPREAEFDEKSNLGYGSLKKELGVSGSLSYGGTVNLDISGGFLKAAAKGELEKTQVKRIKIYGKTRAFTGGNGVRVSGKCAYYAEHYGHNPAKLANAVGDAFVSEIHYGAALYSVLKVKFATKSDYDEYGGDVSFQGGNIQLSSSLRSASENVKSRTKVSFTVHQSGGAAGSSILDILPGHTITCTVNDLSRCAEFMQSVSTYISTSFLGQEQPDSFYNVVGYSVTSYSTYGLSSLVVPEGAILVGHEVKLARHNLEARLKVEREARDRAANILQYASASLSREDTERLHDVLRGARKNTVLIGFILKACQEDPYRTTDMGLNYCSQLYRVASGLATLPDGRSGESHLFRRFDDYYVKNAPLVTASIVGGNKYDLRSIDFHFARGKVSSVVASGDFVPGSARMKLSFKGSNIEYCRLTPSETKHGPVSRQYKDQSRHRLLEVFYPTNGKEYSYDISLANLVLGSYHDHFRLRCTDLNGNPVHNGVYAIANRKVSGTTGKRTAHSKTEYIYGSNPNRKNRMAYHKSAFSGWRTKQVAKRKIHCIHRQNITDYLYDTDGKQLLKLTKSNYENGKYAWIAWKWYHQKQKCSWKWANKYEPYESHETSYRPEPELFKSYRNKVGG